MEAERWLDVFWPSTCAGCGGRGRGLLCGDCVPPGLHRARVDVPGLAGLWTLSRYDAAVGRVVASAKARADRPAMCAVAEVVATRFGPLITPADFAMIVPAPSSRWSLLRRGWSGAAVLAAAASRATGVPSRAVFDPRGGRRQSGLSRAGRLRGLAGAVRVEVELTGRVLLVDDVVTTGATLGACVRELLGAGASEVWALVACVNVAAPRRNASERGAGVRASPDGASCGSAPIDGPKADHR